MDYSRFRVEQMAKAREWLTERYGVGWQARIDPNRIDMSQPFPNRECGCLVAQLGDRWTLTMGMPAHATSQYDAEWKAYIRTWQKRHPAEVRAAKRKGITYLTPVSEPMEQMLDIYGVACDVHPVRTFKSGRQLGAGYDLTDSATFYVYDREDRNSLWHKHCGPCSSFEDAKDWIMAIREGRDD